MGYGLDCRGSIPDRGKILLFSIASRPFLESTQTPIQRETGALSKGVKRPGLEANHSHPSSAEVKNSGAIPALRHTSSWLSA
jgi:hypothetical protein